MRYLQQFRSANDSCRGRGTIEITEAAIHFMQENIENRITMDDVLRYVGYSQSHFSTVFKKKTGLSPLAYFNQLKVQHACELLKKTDTSHASSRRPWACRLRNTGKQKQKFVHKKKSLYPCYIFLHIFACEKTLTTNQKYEEVFVWGFDVSLSLNIGQQQTAQRIPALLRYRPAFRQPFARAAAVVLQPHAFPSTNSILPI